MNVRAKWNSLRAAVASIQGSKITDNKKIVHVAIALDPKFKWIALQPWGEVIAFTDRPVLMQDDSEQYADGFIPEYWAPQPGEQSITTDGPQRDDWRNTARKI